MCGACSVENALKVAFYAYRKTERGNSTTFTQAELESVLYNEPPGAPMLSVLSFKVRSLRFTHYKYMHFLVPSIGFVFRYNKFSYI